MILLTEQTRLEQITQQLKSGALEIVDDQGSQSPKHASNHDSASHQSQKLELLELERREVIGEILRLNPSYKAPADYKPLLKEAKVPIPIKAYPGYNFIGLLLGPESNTQKRLEEETGAKISVYGAKKDTGEKRQITQSDLPEAQGAYEELYVNVSADTYEKVDAAVALIELLLTPVSGSSAVSSINSTSIAGCQEETASVYMISPVADVNQGIPQPVLVTAQPALPQYPPYPAPWYPVASFNTPRPPSGFMPPLPNYSIRFPQSPAGPHSVGPLIGQNPPFGSTLGSSSAVASRPQLPMQAMPQPLNQATPPRSLPMPAQQPPPAYTVTQSQPSSTAPPFTASQSMPYGTMPAPRPPVPVNPQSVSMAPAVQLPNRPLTSPAIPGSSGWPTAPPFVPPMQRPPQMAPPSMAPPMRPQPAVSAMPIASASSALNMSSGVASWPPAVASAPSRPNMPADVTNRPPPANFALSAVFPSRPSSAPPFSSMPPPGGPVSTPVMIPSTSGAPLRAPIPALAPKPPPIPSPAQRPPPMLASASSPMLGPPPFVPQTAALVSPSAPILAQASAPSQSVPPVMARPPIPLQSVATGQAPRPAQPPMPSPQPPPAAPVSNSVSTPSFTPVTPATSTVNTTPIAAPRPPRPVSR
ncbi:proline-rich protein 36-like isoform X2 [Phoenix dactylifera]|uniref:Proline-rich protein 36-like isoform X2 n=1 Tax=Phoenix dactylifera TaxID=42345 RepID=A0A8B7CPY0_PHODC|nr:proline-rich protein 36-like isoform X2 [Phoenix dactylifera]